MKQKSKVLFIVAIVAIIVVSFFCGNAFSKYLTQVTGTGNAEIAKWFFKVNGKEDNLATINLGETQTNANITKGKIAPGSSGEFEISIDATGAEVGIQYQILFQNEFQKPTNLKFLYEGKTFHSLKEIEPELTGIISLENPQKIKVIKIQWQWPYETGTNSEEIAASDIVDTQEGKEAKDYTFDVLITGTQIMTN